MPVSTTKRRVAYPLHAVRALALRAQGLDLALEAGPVPSQETIYQVVERLGCVQIDTLHMVQRSHYLVVWSRQGCYQPTDLDRLIYHSHERRLFEGWQHAACIIPLSDYRYQMPHQRYMRQSPTKWYQNWLSQPGNAELLPAVLERVRREGALRVSDFEYNGPKRGSWWDWKPVKVALEHLYAYGDLMIAERRNFQRVYDLTERILPAWVDTREPSLEERDRYWIEQAVKALGICQSAQAADYAYMKRGVAKPYLDDLFAQGVFVSVEAQLCDGRTRTLIVHRDNLPLLEQAANGDFAPRRTTFLSPFDNLFWARGRDELLWGFRNVLEAYKPASTRTWGYFCLPILHHDRLVGRFDPKLERQNGTLRLKALYLEPGIEPGEELIAGTAAAMRNFLAFHNATELVIERSQPAEFGQKLLAVL